MINFNIFSEARGGQGLTIFDIDQTLFTSDTKINVKKDQIIVVDNSMVQQVEINKKTSFLILENYVMGVLE